MKKLIPSCSKFCSALLILTLFSACADMSARQKLGTTLLTAGLAGPLLGDSDEAKSAAVIASSAVVAGAGASILIVERRRATAQQAREAEANARRAYAQMTEAKREALRQDDIRFLAVDTVQSNDSRGQADIMLWDTKRKQLQSSTVYDVRVAPENGSRVELDTVVTEYVGSGELE